MHSKKMLFTVPALSLTMALAGCGDGLRLGVGRDVPNDDLSGRERAEAPRQTIQEALANRGRQENIVRVNKYIWSASLQVLDFLPIQSVDPFTGVIVTGFGTPPGGGRAYRATVLIGDPALDARSLNVALQTRNGPASTATVRAIEDAILTRARQLRVADNRL